MGASLWVSPCSLVEHSKQVVRLVWERQTNSVGLYFLPFHWTPFLKPVEANGCQDSELQRLTSSPVERTNGLLIFQLHDSWHKSRRAKKEKNCDVKTLN